MQISYNWLKEYVDIELTPQQLAEKMTAAGVAVEHIIPTNKGVKDVYTAKVLSCVDHPEADRLHVCMVSLGEDKEPVQVVCGAPNVKAGIVVPFAVVGAELPDDIKIKKAKLRGVESNGMICSAKELGIDVEKIPPEQKEGIIEMGADTPLGVPVSEILGLDDYILELDLTPNRSDCLSVLNVAYEVGALLGKPVKVPELDYKVTNENIHDMMKVNIQDSDLCHRFVGMMVKGVKIGPSPFWLQHYLQCADVRPINNIVDITNFIMMELGQPLHGYDYQTLKGQQINVRRAVKDEKIITLDGQTRDLTEEMLLICDGEKAVGIAGVMGGENTEVTEDTVDVFIESAYFMPTSVRRTSVKLGLRSEACLRFEKGIDIVRSEYACRRAAQLMQEIAGGEIVGGMIDEYPTVHEDVIVPLRLAQVREVVGIDVSDDEIRRILNSLYFKQIAGENSEVDYYLAPTWRPDISIAQDLIEEVARIYGYDNIPTTLPYGATSRGRLTEAQKMRSAMINKLAGLGLNEILTYSFINKNNDEKLRFPEDDIRRNSIPVLNPLSEEQGHMRTSMLPGMLNVMRNNIKRRNENLALFEMGKVFLLRGEINAQDLADERWSLGIVMGGKTESNWLMDGLEYNFYYAKAVLEAVFDDLHLPQRTYVACQDNPTYHPGRTAKVFIGETQVAVVGELHPEVCDNYGLHGRVYAAEVEVDKILAIGSNKIVMKHLPKFPATSRDMAVVVTEDTPAYGLEEQIWIHGGDILKNVMIFDVYTGNQIADGMKSVAFKLTFQATDRTLTDIEVTEKYDAILRALDEKFDAKLRA